MRQTALPFDSLLPPSALLRAYHYLGPCKRGFPFQDRHGVMVFGSPTSRRLPSGTWLELLRWCLSGEVNAGSRQWAAAIRWVRAKRPEVTTIVSYSDPGVGHTGALYRACNWLWAPTWHRLRPPPSGNGRWKGSAIQAVKDRWVFPLLPDPLRASLLRVNDDSVLAKMPWAEYREPRIKCGRLVVGTGGGDFKRWRALQLASAA